MNYFKSFSADLDQVNEVNFEKVALALFKFQALHNPIYNSYLKYRKVKVGKVNSLDAIPFLPISFFKSHKVVTGPQEDFTDFYSSSGTTGNITSRHFIWSQMFYLENARRIFESEYGPLTDYHVLALLPAYLERPGSSLVTMADDFIKQSGSPHSGFYLYNQEELLAKLNELAASPKKVLLLGVTFALLDFAEQMGHFEPMDNLIVMETGGMKGRRKEMIREEVHEILTGFFKVNQIHSEYGMTELMSQAYSRGGGRYSLPHTMKILLRDVNDPFSPARKRQGGINVIDLANFHSCAFIETQDMGRYDEEGRLEILGRFDNSDVRGCNLLVV
ncbi:acyl transferase [Litoribacter ruber]|uniref:Acyl transferase n=1 Tax=Litoribacter ruber TaxID=702568 RepID=A0AAP2G4H5_9BACT|nr:MULTISPECIES: acyl transferase [Litoribacter]MBS9524076.1 acyl transferase [Litoribacter alkaliphilus]MBT0811340.1 acyl transferase [Litoribacter ruber]